MAPITQQLEELLILNRPNRPGDDVKDNVLPYSRKKEWWEWERAKGRTAFELCG